MLNNIISGTSQSTYTAYVYLNGIPKEIIENIERTNAQSLENFNLLEYFFSMNFKILDQPTVYSESYTNSSMDISYIVNGFNKSRPIEFVAKSSTAIVLDATLTIAYATSTAFPIAPNERHEVALLFSNVLRNVPNSKKFYVLINASSEDEKDITILDYSQGYKITIQTPKEEVIRISSYDKDVYLLTKKIETKNQCVFIGKRGETYTFYSQSSGANKIITVPNDPSIEGEILELK